MRAVVTTDWHLDALTAGVERFDDIAGICMGIVDRALAMGVDELVYLGDLADPDSASIHSCLAFFAECAKKVHAAKKKMVVVPGNHDVVESSDGATIYDALSRWVEVVREPGPMLGKLGFALPYVPRARSYDPAAVVEKAKGTPQVVFGHLNLEKAIRGSESSDYLRGRDVFWPTDAIRKRWPKAKMIGGHYHGAQEVDGVLIVGAPAIFNFGEEKNHPRFIEIISQPKGALEVVSHDVAQARPVLTVRTLEDLEDLEDGALVRVCSADEKVREAAAKRSFSSVPGPIEAEPAAASVDGGDIDYEDTARELAEKWPFEGAMKESLAGQVGEVLEATR